MVLLLVNGCAEVTRPNPTDQEVEAAQLTAARRHPSQTWSAERISRVFLHLLPCLPQVHGRTYPFLGFNWWVTATGKVAVDQVWRPSPAHEVRLTGIGQRREVLAEERRGLKQGDIILAVNNWPIPTEAAAWDNSIKTVRDIFKDFLFFIPVDRNGTIYRHKKVEHYVYMALPGSCCPP